MFLAIVIGFHQLPISLGFCNLLVGISFNEGTNGCGYYPSYSVYSWERLQSGRIGLMASMLLTLIPKGNHVRVEWCITKKSLI